MEREDRCHGRTSVPNVSLYKVHAYAGEGTLVTHIHLGSRFMREAYTWLHASADMPGGGGPATLNVCNSIPIFKFRGKVCARLTSSRT